MTREQRRADPLSHGSSPWRLRLVFSAASCLICSVAFATTALADGPASYEGSTIDWVAERNQAATDKTAFDDLRSRAEGGDGWAAFFMGTLYSEEFKLSKIAPPDDTQACQWYEKAAAQEIAAAAYNLGLCYERGRGMAKDEAKAAALFMKAAAQDHADAMNELGWCYQTGSGVHQDIDQARQWFMRALAAGSDVARRNLAELPDNYAYAKRNFAMNDQAAFQELRTQALGGDAFSQFYLGTLYDPKFKLSKIISPDPNEANLWYFRAADKGNADAQYNIALTYLYGDGLPKDTAAGVLWLQKAAGQEHTDAMNELGRCYDLGIGTPRSLAMARYWYGRAAAAGNKIAKQNLDSLSTVDWDARRDLAGTDQVTFDALRSQAEAGDPNAEFAMGTLYYPSFKYSKIVPPNGNEAFRWFLKSAEHGNAVAQFNVGIAYRDGRGVERDGAKALPWFRQAADKKYAYAMNELGIA